MSPDRPPKPRFWTWRDLRELSAGAAAAAALAAGLEVVFGLSERPLVALAALAALGLCWATGAWQRGLREVDSPWIDTVERLRLPALMSLAIGGALFLGTLLLVHAGVWTAWLMVAAPAAAVICVRTAFLLSDEDVRRLLRASLLLSVWSLATPSAAIWALLWLGTLAAVSALVCDRLWIQTRAAVWKGRVRSREWAARWVPAAGALTILLAALGAWMPRMAPRWDIAGASAREGPLEVVFDFGDAGERPGEGPPAGSEPAALRGEREKDGGSPAPQAPISRRIVVKPPNLGNFRGLLRDALALLRERGPLLALVVVSGLPALYGVRRLWKAFRGRGRPGESPLEELARQVQDLRRRRRIRGEPAVPADPRRAVIHHYHRWRESADRHGYKLQAHLTPREYARFLAVRLGDRERDIERITSRFESACYGDRPVPPEEGEAAAADTRAFVNYLATKR